MRSYLNNKGVALLTVMLVMGAAMMILNVVIYAASREKLAVNDYNNYKQAFYVAEAASDYAVTKWIDFINQDIRQNEPDLPAPMTIGEEDITDLYLPKLADVDSQLVAALRSELENTSISVEYGYDIPEVLYETHSVDADNPENTPEKLTVNIQAQYNGVIYPYQVTLSYCSHGIVFTYKGQATH